MFLNVQVLGNGEIIYGTYIYIYTQWNVLQPL